MTNRALLLSGGGSWSAYGGGTLARLNNNYDTIIGVSAGSLLAPLAALNEWEILKNEYTNVTNKNVFDGFWYKSNPLNDKGKLKVLPIITSLILGQKSIATSNALRKTIDEYFPESYFNELRKQNKEVFVGTQNYAQKPSKIHYFSSMNEDYESFKDWMWCSANFPFFTSLVKKSWKDINGNFHVGLWSDGGLTDLVGINQLIAINQTNGRKYREVDIIVHGTKEIDVYEGMKINNLIESINTSINAMRYYIKSEYLYDKINKLNHQGARVNVYWLPRKLSANCMVFNQKEMTSWWEEGYNTALDSNRIEIFEPIIKKI